ncbi:MAG TPA: hypothetical protein VMW10_08035 [Alphaproteobacteria bacterium]|nr:hypothetical protein [Alphaproteobacteria bacterium]
MTTEKQKQKMLDCICTENFCNDVRCQDCPLWRGNGVGDCLMVDLRHKVEDIRIKKLCPTCGKEIEN